ncbi:hypothetical protein CB1_000632021 [Camelus ferus]|nr:hypothetical protein CB1_000632021 [Camelus ferus]
MVAEAPTWRRLGPASARPQPGREAMGLIGTEDEARVQQKYLVVTCNYEARKLGVKKLMNVRDAKEKCPQLVLINGEDLTRYREMSYKVTELLEEFSPVVERLGFDENFVDLTEMVGKRLQQLQSDEIAALTVSGHVYNNQAVNLRDLLHVRLLVGSQIAAEMREAMYIQLGLTGCAGVASNKLLAKLVSGVFKPNQQTVLLPESSQDLIHSLNHIKEIPGIGYKTAKRLEALGISNVRDLQTFSSKILEKELGISVAQRIQKLSLGEDHSPVTPSGPPQSEQLFSKNRITDSHKQPLATVSHHEGLTENREQDSTDEKITFPSDIDPEVFYELPEEVQKELLADWKRTGSDFHTT